MKHLLMYGAVLLFAIGCSKPSGSRPSAQAQGEILEYFFVGGDAVTKDPLSKKVREVFSIAEATALRHQVASALAQAPKKFLDAQPDSQPVAELAGILGPMMEEAWSQGHYLHIRGNPQAPLITLAVPLAAGRANLWQTNLLTATIATKYGKITQTNSHHLISPTKKGWYEFHMGTEKNWFVLEARPAGKPSEFSAFIQKLQSTGYPPIHAGMLSNKWVMARGRTDVIAGWNSAFKMLPAGSFDLSIHPRAGNDGDLLVSNARLTLDKTPGFQIEPWNIPTNIIRDPVNSFVAIQGVKPSLQALDLIKALKLSDVPNQIFAWSVDFPMPFSTYVAFPFANARKELESLPARLRPVLNKRYRWSAAGDLSWTTNDIAKANTKEMVLGEADHGLVAWHNLVPELIPFATTSQEKQGEFMVLGVFPDSLNPQRLPQALISQITGRTNLVYYDWEITGTRAGQWRRLKNMASLLVVEGGSTQLTSGEKWVHQLKTLVGNTATEARWNGGKELEIVRNSHIGLTGLELVALVNWVDSPGFPLSAKYAPAASKAQTRPIAPPSQPKAATTRPGSTGVRTTPTPNPTVRSTNRAPALIVTNAPPVKKIEANP